MIYSIIVSIIIVPSNNYIVSNSIIVYYNTILYTPYNTIP